MEALAWEASYHAARMVLTAMRQLEEQVPDPAVRWEFLRATLEQFSSEQGGDIVSDEQSRLAELNAMNARLDRLESLVGTAYGASGTVRPALENAVLQQDIGQMRQEVTAVLNFLRDANPNP